MNSIKPSTDERIAFKKVREEMLIANIDKAIGMAPKLSHPPVYKDHELTIDFKKLTEILALRQRARIKAQIRYEKEMCIASKRLPLSNVG